jgi:hypothetical protein
VLAVLDRAMPAFRMFSGVGKSGWPMQKETISLPWRTSALTSASTTKAFSVPSDSARRDSLRPASAVSFGAFIVLLLAVADSVADTDRESASGGAGISRPSVHPPANGMR